MWNSVERLYYLQTSCSSLQQLYGRKFYEFSTSTCIKYRFGTDFVGKSVHYRQYGEISNLIWFWRTMLIMTRKEEESLENLITISYKITFLLQSTNPSCKYSYRHCYSMKSMVIQYGVVPAQLHFVAWHRLSSFVL